MQVITSLENIRIDERTVVALGNFDGVHIGHRTILEGAVSAARRMGIAAACYTFSNHPVNYFWKKSGKEGEGVKLICTEEDKLALLEELGFDYVINVEFNDYIANMSPRAFVEDILSEKLNADMVCCGFNYTFGARAEGNVDFLKQKGDELAIEVSVHDAVELDGETVSSTLIRKLIAAGDMEKVNRCLGRAYTLSGTVVHGNHIGNRIGFPTMNISAPLSIALPPNGVYFTRAYLDGKCYSAISNLGVKPTIGEHLKSIETFLFDYEGDAYGSDIRVEFLVWERPECKFESVEALRERIALDCKMAEEYHRNSFKK
ncbi:MAG: bifunctional riboflavin kinase/FAD synthetase [Firmicutes bacterium]|nr:bifunctional riboflavin kinase/FAD synthetase [Bacillota bacterium]